MQPFHSSNEKLQTALRGAGQLAAPARRRRLQIAILACLLAVWGGAGAQSVWLLQPEAEIASVGDSLGVRVVIDAGAGGAELACFYAMDVHASYVAESGILDGVPLSDGLAVVDNGSHLLIDLGILPPGLHTLDFELLVRGAIGERVVHDAALTVDGLFPPYFTSAYPTHIEDESAWLSQAPIEADATLDDSQPAFNFGLSAVMRVSESSPIERRAILRPGDLGGIAPGKDELLRGILQLFSARPVGIDWSLQARAVRSPWVEGQRDGAPCVTGASWLSPDCSLIWTGGGDLELDSAGTTVVATGQRLVQIDIRDLVLEWVAGQRDPDGVVLQSTKVNPNRTLELVSLDAPVALAPAPRLSVVHAPKDSYTKQAVDDSRAEILPNDVSAGLSAQRFVYSFDLKIRDSETGVNRIAVAIPTGFGLVSIDSVLVDGVALMEDTDSVFATDEYQDWSADSMLDIRTGRILDGPDDWLRVDLVFRASTPLLSIPGGVEFMSWVDHDRRGLAPQATRENDGNRDNSDDDSWLVRVGSVKADLLSIAPSDTAVAVGDSIQFVAYAHYPGGLVDQVTELVSWSFTPPGKLLPGSKPGVAQAKNAGPAQVQATLVDLSSALADVNIGPAELRSIELSPGALAIARGDTATFLATGYYSDGTSLDISGSADWSAVDPAVATHIENGSFDGTGDGVTDIDASVGLVSSPASQLVVGPPELRVLSVSPADTTVALGEEATLSAWGRFSDGSTADLSEIVQWDALPPGVLDVGVGGLSTTLAEGVAWVTAVLDSTRSLPARFEVTAPRVVSLDGSPDGAVLPVGADVQLHSVAAFTDDSQLDVTAAASWVSLEPAIASIVSAGRVRALSIGVARIHHQYAGVSGDTLLVSVSPATVDSLVLSPCPLLLPVGAETKLHARAYLSDASELDVCDQAIWSSEDSLIASVDSTGLVRMLVEGSTRVLASWQGIQANSCEIVVDNAALDALFVAPSDTTLASGQEMQARAWGQVGAESLDLSSSVDWSAGDSLVAAVDSTGWVRTFVEGVTSIDASLGAIVATGGQLTVEAPAVESIAISPQSAALLLGRSKNFVATAFLSDGSQRDVSSLGTWQSSAPSVAFVESDGLARALSVGVASLNISFDGVSASVPAEVAVSPSVSVLATATGQVESHPGQADRHALSVRATNHYLISKTLAALRILIDAAPDVVASLTLFVDDGDGEFDPLLDARVASGAPVAGQWTANGLGIEFGVSQSRTLFVAMTPSLTTVAHGSELDLLVEKSTDFFFSTTTAVVAPDGFPLDSPGQVTVEDLVLAQLGFTAVPADSIAPAQRTHPVFQWTVPDDGGSSDVLERVELLQLGTARWGSELSALRLFARDLDDGGIAPGVQAGYDELEPADPRFEFLGNLVLVGGNRYAATALAHAIPAGGLELLLVADMAAGAELGRTLRMELPLDGLEFESGRSGPVDHSWANPSECVLAVIPELQIRPRALAPPATVLRGDRRVPLLATQLLPLIAATDSLLAMELDFFDPQSGVVLNASPEISRAELWLDLDGDGRATASDSLLSSASPQAGMLRFDDGPGWPLVLLPSQPLSLLVTGDPDSARVRDGEQFALRIDSAAQLSTTLATPATFPLGPANPVETALAPTVDGQDLAGYALQDGPGGIAIAGSGPHTLFDLRIPSNGSDADRLRSIEILNLGSAGVSEIDRLELWRDDGDGVANAGDQLLGALKPAGGSGWRLDGLDEALYFGDARRFRVQLHVADELRTGGSFLVRIPVGGIQVESGNDGPRDLAHTGSAAYSLAVGNQLTWVAESLPGAEVAADATRRPALVLSGFNAYAQDQMLSSLAIAETGSAADPEFDIWSLHLDADADGRLDPEETAISVATQNGSEIRFDGFALVLPAREQRRLFVAYSLAANRARDGSTVNAQIDDASGFGYSGVGSTDSAGDFPLDSPGNDLVNGLYSRQIQTRAITPLSLGGGERDVLVADLLLPSNGFESDVLTSLTVELSGSPAVQFGEDVQALRLYRELDADPSGASFDPAEDLLVSSILDGSGALVFRGFSAAIPAGGRRFYLSCDLTASPVGGRLLGARIPVNGIDMASENDGPLDLAVDGGVGHPVSASDLLLAVEVAPQLLSAGQQIDISLIVENRGNALLSGVQTLDLQLPSGASHVFGPLPTSLDLDPGETDSLLYRFALDEAGSHRFVASVGLADSSAVSIPALSPWVVAEQVPTGFALSPLSTLPLTINRGSVGLTPLVWQLSHPDSNLATASIEIRSLAFDVEDAGGVAQPANSVLRRLRVRSGGQELAYLDPVGPAARVVLDLDPPLLLPPGAVRSVPLDVDIDPGATATSFRLSLDQPWAAAAIDPNSGASLPLQSALPWSSTSALLRTVASHVDVALLDRLPAAANRGQQAVPGGSFRIALPGSAGDSEARVFSLAVVLREPSGAPVDPGAVMDLVRVRSGALELLAAAPASDASGRLELPLGIPKVVASGAPEELDLLFDISVVAGVDSLIVSLADSASYVVRDPNSGLHLPLAFDFTQGGVSEQGPMALMVEAEEPLLTLTDRAPTTVAPGAADLELVELSLEHPGAEGQATISLSRVTLRLLDEGGNTLVPTQVLNSLELRDAAGVAVVSASLPTSALPIDLGIAPALLINPSSLVGLHLVADLAGDLGEDWIRVALDASALDLRDANDPTRSLGTQGKLPFATELIHVLQAANAIAVGVPDDPPANVLRGDTGVALLDIHVLHPGASNETEVRADSLLLRTFDLAGVPTDAGRLFDGATVMLADQILSSAELRPSGLLLDLTALPALSPGETLELRLLADIADARKPSDFRLGIDAADLSAQSQGAGVGVEGLGGTTLPYRSPAIHRLGGDVASTLSNYPNPFAAGRDATNIAFVLERAGRVTVDLYTLDGQRVATLLDGVQLDAGLHDDIRWDGRNGEGAVVRNGVYLLRVEVEGRGGGRYLHKVAVAR